MALNTVQRSDSASSIHTAEGSDYDAKSDKRNSTSSDHMLDNGVASEGEKEDGETATTPVASRRASSARKVDAPPMPDMDQSLPVEVESERPGRHLSPVRHPTNTANAGVSIKPLGGEN